VTAAFVFLAVIEGWLAPLRVLWKGVLPLTSLVIAPIEIPPIIQVVLVCLMALIAVGVGLEVRRHKDRFLLFVFTSLLMLSASYVLALYRFFWNPFPVEMALVLGYLMVLVFLRTALGARRLELKRIFNDRLHPRAMRALDHKETFAQFSGTLKQGSILVCTLNNHRELIEVLRPEAYVAMTNLYLQVASNFLVDVGAYLEECSGESLRVLFGIPVSLSGSTNHAVKAIRAALDLTKRLDELNTECDARWQQRLDFRIGIDSGEMMAGLYGGSALRQYSVAGPVVEFAHYLCAACMNYGCRILVGPNTYEMAETTAEFRSVDLLERQSSRRRVELYEVLSLKNNLSLERERSRDLFWQGVLFFRSEEWDKAVEAFTAARIFGIPDKALDLYLERIERARRGDEQLMPEQSLLTKMI